VIVLVTGGRDYANAQRVDEVLRFWLCSQDILVHGDARGADALCRQWCESHGVHHAAVPALWRWAEYQGQMRAAGHRRNGIMLLLRPEVCFAFPGGNGTAGMVKLSRAAGVPVIQC
jgi:hypothetical protein